MKNPLPCWVQLLMMAVFLIGSHASMGQNRPMKEKKPIPQAALEHIKANKQKLQLSDSDLEDLELSSQTETKHNGVKHLYIKQTHKGIEIHGAVNTLNMTKDGKVISMSNRFKQQIGKKIKAGKPQLDAAAAVEAAARHLNTAVKEALVVKEKRNEKNGEVLFTNGGISLEPITAKLVYQPMEDGSLILAWEVSIYELDGLNWWKIRVDANTGRFLDKDNLVAHCLFENNGPGGAFLHANHNHATTPLVEEELPIPYALRLQETSMLSTSGSYRVLPMPAESPSHGDFALVSGMAADPVASPSGWHTAGATTYTITRGNNVHAYEDPDNTGYLYYGSEEVGNYSPDGGSALLFDFPIDFSQEPATYRDAAITNLFFWNNLIHDVWYQYGFDEASGNFQAVNFGAEGLGSDHVMAEAQDSRNIGSVRNNANFGTPEDGVNPRMQMYLWSPLPDPDMFRVTSPGEIAGSYPATLAAWGAALSETPLTGKLVLAQDGAEIPNEGCSPFTNAAEIAGNIAVVYRGSCPFVQKAANAQAAGAIALIVINNGPGDPVAMGGSGSYSIPALMIGQSSGALIRAQMDAGTEVMVSLKDESGPEVDGDLDNGIIVHEYGHGISNRLTGGRDIVNCLGNAEQMGEGWSDWLGLMMTIKPGDTPDKIRGIGTYAQSQPTDGQGIRPAPYSTDFGINPYTYGMTNSSALSQPHGVGFVWATMLWDMTWDLIAEYGYDEDIYKGNGGNNMAMQLVIDGLKMQACRPGFVDGRDAILAADMVNYGGANQELIWRAFAKRGLGFSASQGSNTSRFDQEEAFDLPPVYACDAPTITVTPTNNVYTGGVAENIYLGYGPQSVMLTASGDPTFAYTWSPASGLSDANIANPIFTPTTAGSYTFTVTAVNADACTRTATVTIEVLDVRCGPKNNKFMVCHNGSSLCLDAKGVADHLAHGDQLGDCGTGSSLLADAVSLKATQNPFGRKTSFEFMTEQEVSYQLEIRDRDGNLVAIVARGVSKAGEVQSVEFDRGLLLDGLYIARLVTANESKSVRIMVMGR